MLTIPAAIQALYKTDGVRKNFRAHFPSGELADITNDDVVRESVRFTESICSQNVLRFGLTEASLIEFETVGVPNMMGMVIECGIEIDTSSLTAAQISAIQSDPGDGTLVLVSDSDTGFGYYRIPYGVFRVYACPRNQQAMTHRRVQAYSTAGAGLELSALEQAKLAAPGPQATFPVNVRKLAFSLMASADSTGILSANHFTRTLFADSSAFFGSSVSITFDAVIGGVTRSLDVDINTGMGSLAASVMDVLSVPQDKIFEIDPGGFTTVLPQVLEWLDDNGIDYAAMGYESMLALVLDKMPQVCAAVEWSNINPIGVAMMPEPVTASSVIYPPRGGGLAARITVPTFVRIRNAGLSLLGTFSPTDATPASLYTWEDGAAEAQMLSIVSTGGGKATKKYYTFTDAYALDEFLNAYLEIHGQFAKVSRGGGFEIFALDDSSPAAIGAADSIECWWDEYNVDPVGSVLCTYGADQTVRISFDAASRSVYEMPDNYILTHMANADEAIIAAMLRASLLPALRKVGFTPADLQIRALPWIEAGDALQITAEDGTVVDTYALQHVVSGIQDLRADILSQGGEIIGEA